MGTFNGHVMPGTLYVVLGSWYVVQATVRYTRCRLRGRRFESSCGFTETFWNVPIDSIAKLVTIGIYTPVELFYGFTNIDGSLFSMISQQHVTIAAALALASLLELVKHYKFSIPKDSEYLGNAIFFCVETLTIYFHLHGSALEVRLHQLFLLAAAMGLVVVTAEAMSRHHVMLPIMRGVVFMLRGSWLVQVGFVLYNPVGSVWDQTMESNVTVVSLHFCWHLMANVMVAFAISILAAKMERKTSGKGGHSEMSTSEWFTKLNEGR